jgi:hypothetical protein
MASRQDTLTLGTRNQIVENNEAREAFCRELPPPQ